MLRENLFPEVIGDIVLVLIVKVTTDVIRDWNFLQLKAYNHTPQVCHAKFLGSITTNKGNCWFNQGSLEVESLVDTQNGIHRRFLFHNERAVIPASRNWADCQG